MGNNEYLSVVFVRTSLYKLIFLKYLFRYTKSTVNTHESQNITNDEEELQLMKAAKEIDGRLECPICFRTLSQRKILKLHIRSHVGKNLMHCTVCNRGFAKGSNLTRHMLLHRSVDTDEEDRILRTAHLNDGRYSCTYCGKIIIDRQTFKLHIRQHISKAFFPCNLCNREFQDNIELQKHLIEHNNVLQIEKVNDKTQGDGEEIRWDQSESHRKIIENASKEFSCDVCKKVFNRKDNLK